MNRFTRTARSLGILSTTALVSLAGAAPVLAQSSDCDPSDVPVACDRLNADVTVVTETAPNTERRNTASTQSFDDVGFSISLDNEPIAGAPLPRVMQRDADRALASADVQVKYDGLDVKPLLNVATADLRASYPAGAAVPFRASSNYPAYIARAEVVVRDTGAPGSPVIARVPIAPNGQANWSMPAAGSGEYEYVLMAYDRTGRRDETQALPVLRSDKRFATEALNGDIIAAGEGEDRTRVRNIRVDGGAVTAYGANVSPGTSLRVMGEQVIVDGSGDFAMQRILPPGDQSVGVDILNGNTVTRRISRDINIPTSEFFYVGIVDVTLGKRLEDELEEASGDFDDTYAEGRVALYLKGRIKGSTLITMSADTGEGELNDLFGRLNDKDPRNVLRRLDPDDYYPVYGDDSTSYDDTPTSGRIYVRVEREGSHVLWGDFNAGIDGQQQFLRNDRTLYGAQLRYVSPGVTANGQPEFEATAYAASPDTLPQRDTFRGTGGSAYFLSRQDINGASETVSVEIRDPDTGLVIERRNLQPGVDYSFDYIQGVIILTSPLASTASEPGLVKTGVLGENNVNLVVNYEYTPPIGSLDGASVGGRAVYRPNEQLTFGFTQMRENTGVADQDMTGVDFRYELSDQTWLEGEWATSEGPGFGRSLSTDGGLTIIDGATAGTDTRADAYRLSGQVDLRDVGAGMDGFLGFYLDRKDAGFSSLDYEIAADQSTYGVYGSVDLNQRTTLRFDAERFRRQGAESKDEFEIDVSYKLSAIWTVEAGLQYLDQDTPGDADKTGSRTDLGLRLTYAPSDNLSLYVFGQATLKESGGLGDNDRIGVGGSARLSEKVTVSGEVSDGSKGFGAQARLTYSPSANQDVYIGYTLDPLREVAGRTLRGRDEGTLVAGFNQRYNDRFTAFGENTYDFFGDRRSFTRAYGVTYTPTDIWSYAAAWESGRIEDDVSGDFDRGAYSVSVAYADDAGLSARAKLEYRNEDGVGLTRDRDTWLLALGAEYKYNDSWRFLGSLDALVSESDQSSFRDGEFIEASIGAAYRPVEHDRTNALFKYTYLRDLPGEDQTTADGSDDGPKQISHVLSFDINHDLNEHLTLGAKYGFRKSEIAARGSSSFSDSTAHLAILRADWHVIHKWDIIGEGRMLYTEETKTRENGALLGVYRHVGANAKVGVGYEWGEVSDDITDLDYENSGVFLNVIAKF